MLRTTAPGSVAGAYVDRNVPLGIAGTRLVAADRNAIQEEICNVIEGAGLILSASDSQLLEAIRALVAENPGDKIRGFFSGQALSSQSSLTIATGSCLDSTGSRIIKMSIGDSWTKTLSAYAAGDGNGGLMYGSVYAATTHRARSSNVATLTLGAGHGYKAGDVVIISSVGGSGYNTSALPPTSPDGVVISSVTSTTISYQNTGGDEGSTADTAGRVAPKFLHAFALSNSSGSFQLGFAFHRVPDSLPSGITLFRRLFSFGLAADGTIKPFAQSIGNPDMFTHLTRATFRQDTTQSTTDKQIVTNVPPRCTGYFGVYAGNGSGAVADLFNAPQAARTTGIGGQVMGGVGDRGGTINPGYVLLGTDYSARIKAIADIASTNVYISDHYWLDARALGTDDLETDDTVSF